MTKEFSNMISEIAKTLTKEQDNEHFTKYEKSLTTYLAYTMWKLKSNDLKNTLEAMRSLEYNIMKGEL